MSAINESNDLDSPMPSASLFLLHPEDIDILLSSAGFMILRDHLAEHYNYDLCDEHAPSQSDLLPQWLILRDALHAMLVPIVELFDKAVSLATSTTRATRLEDLEYAFTGEARSAFLWLQCFLAAPRERDWCYTRGCPACVVEHALDSEFCVRLLHAACLLSDVHYPFTIEGPTLPSFMFFLDALAAALAADPLFGPQFFERMHPKAVVTRNGIEELIRQCIEVDNVLSQPSTPDVGSPATSAPASPVLGPLGANPSAGKAHLKIKRGKVARRQMTLQLEEEQWIEEMRRRCWDQLPSLSTASPESLGPVTPDIESATLSLDAVLKAEPQVVVKEISPEG